MKRPKSTCCGAVAKLDKTASAPTWFCTKCVKTCALKAEERKFSTLGTKRTPTGERALFEQLYKDQMGRCAISNRDLWPPEHPQFHCQGCHLLPKGTYPEERLNPRNIVMVRKMYHDLWEAERDKEKLLKIEPRFEPYVRRYNRFFAEAQQHNRPWESATRTSSE